MKQVINLAVEGPVKVRIEDGPIPEPTGKQVRIKVIVSGSNPKDWKMPEYSLAYKGPDNGSSMARSKKGVNQGDDIAGIIDKVGDEVTAFKKGDRVAAFHQMGYPGGSYAEYAIAYDWVTFHLPASTSFEEAATIPLAGNTAAVALWYNLRLPTPWLPATEPTPFIVYGASSSVGSFAIKFARHSNIHPIIAVAGKGSQHVESLLDRSKGDAVFDYRDGDEKVISQIRAHLKDGKFGQVLHGLDPGIGKPSENVLNEIVASNGAINLVLPSDITVKSATKSTTSCGVVYNTDDGAHGPDGTNLGVVANRWFSQALRDGTFKGHPYEIKKGGLEGVQQALQDLKDGKQSAVKYVFRIADTPGLEGHGA